MTLQDKIMKIEGTDVRNEQDDAFVASQLGAYNAAFTVRDFKLSRAFARDTSGKILGGLLADSCWQYLEVHKALGKRDAPKRGARFAVN